jgi:hypothetical protein
MHDFPFRYLWGRPAKKHSTGFPPEKFCSPAFQGPAQLLQVMPVYWLEKLALSRINLAIMQGLRRNIAFRVVKR